MKTPIYSLAATAAALSSVPARAQDHMGHQMDHMDHGERRHGQPQLEDICVAVGAWPAWAQGSGTSRLPAREGTIGGDPTCFPPPSPHQPGGLHIIPGDGWMLMAHGFVSAQYTDHKEPRGGDKFYSTSMAMLMAQKDFGGAKLELRSMLSLEPAMDAKGYPNLFATGETAGGEPLVDRQHPHDLFMELAARVDVDVAPGTSLFLYGGPVGEPALGPSAFMHRGSAALNPEPPITHHWFDSTHITYGIVTAGVATSRFQIEASAFRGAEPDEDRWDIETPKLDSWSARLTWNPRANWAAQVSHGFIKQPEATHPGENEHRTTVSVHYSAHRGLKAMAAFSAKNRDPGDTLTAWLAEASYDLSRQHKIFGRIENVKNDELFHDHSDPLHDRAFRVTKLQGGYAWTTPLGDSPFNLSLGGSMSAYLKPADLDVAYGKNPWGYTLFTRLSLGH